MYSSLILFLQPIYTPQERLCTVLSYYFYSQYILPRNVYVQFSFITIIANTSFPGTFMYSSLLIIANTSFPGTFMYSSLLLRLQLIQPSQEHLCTLRLQPIHPSQERLCTVLSYKPHAYYYQHHTPFLCQTFIYIIDALCQCIYSITVHSEAKFLNV